MHQEWNSFYRRGYPGRFSLQQVPGSQPGEEASVHHEPPLKPCCWGRRTNLQQEIDKKDFSVENICKHIFPAAAQLVSHGGGQYKATRSEAQPAQVLWDVMIKFSISNPKKNLKEPLVLVHKWQLRSVDNLLLKFLLGVLCDTYFSGAVIRLSLSPSSSCSTA